MDQKLRLKLLVGLAKKLITEEGPIVRSELGEKLDIMGEGALLNSVLNKVVEDKNFWRKGNTYHYTKSL